MNDRTFLVRAGLGIAFFVVLGLWDVLRHPENPRRAKEYVFLLSMTVAAMAYAVLHDLVTYHISPAYFVYGKGLAEARGGLGWPVVKLALLAGWSPGLIAGAALLIANNRDRAGRQLPYAVLWRHALAVLVASGGTACLLGCIFSLFPARIADLADLALSGEQINSFIAVWGIHVGTYVGALFGLGWACLSVVRTKRRLCPPT